MLPLIMLPTEPGGFMAMETATRSPSCISRLQAMTPAFNYPFRETLTDGTVKFSRQWASMLVPLVMQPAEPGGFLAIDTATRSPSRISRLQAMIPAFNYQCIQ